MDILKLKEQFGKTDYLKEKIKKLDAEIICKKKELETYLKPIMDKLYREVCEEINGFFISNGFELKLDGNKRKYQYGDNEIIILVYGGQYPTLSVNIEIKTENIHKYITLFPANDKELFYYGEEPWNRISMNMNSSTDFSIYLLEMFDDPVNLQAVKEEYEKTLDRISYTKSAITNLTEFSYCYESIMRKSFAEVFSLI